MPSTNHEATVSRDGSAYILRCACGLWLCSDFREVAGELAAHMGASLPGYAVPSGL